MTDTEIRTRISAGEDSRTQFKCGPIGVGKLSSELAAFANAEGGVILFGVKDDGTVVGLDIPAKKQLNDELSNASNDSVRPAIYPRTEYHTIEDKLILAVIVSEGVSKPYADKSGHFWIKAGPDKRRITSREQLQRLLQASLLIHADELPVPKTSLGDSRTKAVRREPDPTSRRFVACFQETYSITNGVAFSSAAVKSASFFPSASENRRFTNKDASKFASIRRAGSRPAQEPIPLISRPTL